LDEANLKELKVALQGFIKKGETLQLETKVSLVFFFVCIICLWNRSFLLVTYIGFSRDLVDAVHKLVGLQSLKLAFLCLVSHSLSNILLYIELRTFTVLPGEHPYALNMVDFNN